MASFWVLAVCVALLGACASQKAKANKKAHRAPVSAAAHVANDRLYHKGVEQYLNGDLKGAMRTWKKVLQVDPAHVDAKRSLTRTAQELSALEQFGK